MKNVLHKMKNTLQNIWIVFCAICILFYVRGAVVDGSSMENTLKDGDFIILKITKDVKFGDIVAIKHAETGKTLCKRVIGVAGDTVKIKDGQLFINNKEQIEEYVKDSDWAFHTKNMKYVIPQGSVFVMGDNRNNSLDSRALGLFDVDDIIGVSLLNITRKTGITYKTFLFLLLVSWIFCIYFAFLHDKVWYFIHMEVNRWKNKTEKNVR